MTWKEEKGGRRRRQHSAGLKCVLHDAHGGVGELEDDAGVKRLMRVEPFVLRQEFIKEVPTEEELQRRGREQVSEGSHFHVTCLPCIVFLEENGHDGSLHRASCF